MNSVRILHTADLHIGAGCSYLSAAAPVRRKEILKTFENIISLANESKVDLLLIAGDLFDSNKVEADLVDGVFSALDKLENAKAVIALGNHDPYTADSPFLNRKLNPYTYILSPTDCVLNFDNLGCRVYGASFDGVYCEGANRFAITPPDDDLVNIMVIHGEARSDLGGNYRSITPEFVRYSGMDYIALGHIHKMSDVQYLGTTALAYCGCPEGQGFDESGEKGVYIGTISKGKADLESVKVARRTHYCLDIDVTDCDDIERKIKEEISETGENFAENYFKITLIGKIKDNIKIDTAGLLASLSVFVAFIKIKDKTVADVDYNILKEEKTLKGYFTALMLEKIETASDSEKEKYILALEKGLESFSGEVKFDED